MAISGFRQLGKVGKVVKGSKAEKLVTSAMKSATRKGVDPYNNYDAIRKTAQDMARKNLDRTVGSYMARTKRPSTTHSGPSKTTIASGIFAAGAAYQHAKKKRSK